jgi:site-specific recombinase XerD
MTNPKKPSDARALQPVDTGSLKQVHVDAVVAAASEAHAPKTLSSYRTAWKQFETWCSAEGYEALPCEPTTVAAYLTHRAEAGLSRSTLSIDRAAIRHHHEAAGFDPTGSAGVKRVMRGLRRRAAAAGQKQATGIRAADLGAIRATACLRRSGSTGRTESEAAAKRRGRVDIALISVMRDAMLRRSEAAALRWADVEFCDDETARVTIRRSRGDQDGEGAVQFVSKDAAKALIAIRPEDVELTDRVFGLRSGRAISMRIAAAAKAAGLVGEFSGHSPRVGMARDLVASGASVAAVQVAGRWKSARLPATYARGELAGQGAVARLYEASDDE